MIKCYKQCIRPPILFINFDTYWLSSDNFFLLKKYTISVIKGITNIDIADVISIMFWRIFPTPSMERLSFISTVTINIIIAIGII